MRYFIDSKDVVWTVAKSGECNHPSFHEIKDDKVVVVGDFVKRGSYQIDAELAAFGVTSLKYEKLDGEKAITYPLYDSLIDLAIAKEAKKAEHLEGRMTLDEAVVDSFSQAASFKRWWLENHKVNPDEFPLSLPNDNAGLWAEQLREHCENSEL
ncbi:hypothetical protein [Vibrio harveyi]|uniref:hypothetical protein n=1 Tax=Vibrio harveyi TaxID=669 RepID=UPI003CF2F789